MGLTIIATIIILLLILCGWCLMQRLRRGSYPQTECTVHIEGGCGDTFQMALEFKNQKLIRTRYRTTGCAYSLMCLRAAAELAKDKTPSEIKTIDRHQIARAVGGLPPAGTPLTPGQYVARRRLRT